MTMFLRHVIAVLVFSAVSHSDAHASFHFASSCADDAIQAAVDAAADGDTVAIPPCPSGSWSRSVTVPSTKGITLRGAGAPLTVINLNGNRLVLQTSSANRPLRVKGITFVHTTPGVEAITIIGTAPDWQIDNNVFDSSGVAGTYSIRVGTNDANVDSFTYGVIDHNQFINRIDATSIFVEWPRGALDAVATGDWIWSQSPERGTAQAVYVEDNLFSGTGKSSQVIDARWGAKFVLRYNTIHNPWISTHSGCTNFGRNPLWAEVYRNTFTDDEGHYTGSQIELRSVSGVVFANTSSTPLNQFFISIDHERSFRADCDGPFNAICDGTRSYDQNEGAHGYVCLGQPGWGPQASDRGAPRFAGVFAWDNSNYGKLVDMIVANNHGFTPEHVQPGREFFNALDMGRGPIADRPTTCSTGPTRTVYVSTDENAIGATVYVCADVNVWTKHWDPLTYPHPLVGRVEMVPPPPGPPRNLRIVR